MEIGAQISSIRPYIQTPGDLLESLKKIKKIGYNIVQIQWISPDITQQFIKDALEETQLECVGTQDYYDNVIHDLDRVIEMNNILGGTYICVSGIPESFRSLEGCMAFAVELNRIAEYAKGAGKVLVLHPRFQDFVEYDSGETNIDILLKNTVPDFQIELDVYHVKKAGFNTADWIYRVSGHMDLVHFKDMAIDSNGKEVLTPVGQGILEWNDIIEACIKTQVKYCFAEQEQWQKDPFECLKDSYEFIRTHTGNITE